MKLVDFGTAILSGKPFRHFTMAKLSVPVWFKIHSNTEVLVLGPDDIIPMDEAIPMQWRTARVFEIKSDE